MAISCLLIQVKEIRPDVLKNAFEKNRGVQNCCDDGEASWFWRNCILRMLFAFG